MVVGIVVRIVQNVGLLHAIPHKALLKTDARKVGVEETSNDSQILVQATGAVARAVALKGKNEQKDDVTEFPVVLGADSQWAAAFVFASRRYKADQQSHLHLLRRCCPTLLTCDCELLLIGRNDHHVAYSVTNFKDGGVIGSQLWRVPGKSNPSVAWKGAALILFFLSDI